MVVLGFFMSITALDGTYDELN